uniref:Uncharacterized protein n=1 Tax=Rhizophora mucronata TaxID=61149 RepID=A0A2P2NL55_RHIMU
MLSLRRKNDQIVEPNKQQSFLKYLLQFSNLSSSLKFVLQEVTDTFLYPPFFPTQLSKTKVTTGQLCLTTKVEKKS